MHIIKKTTANEILNIIVSAKPKESVKIRVSIFFQYYFDILSISTGTWILGAQSKPKTNEIE